MKRIPKAKSWEETLRSMRSQLSKLDESDRAAAHKKIAALEKAIALRDSLSATSGGISFSR